MNVLLLLLFIIMEIAFVVYTLAENKDKKIWIRNRFFVNLIEIGIYFLFVLFPGIDFSFRFKGFLIVMMIRIILSGIVYLLSKKKTESLAKNKKSVSVILGCIGGILLVSISLLPSFIFADYNGRPVTGSHEVAMAEAILIDENRVEEFETDGSKREVPIHVFYPEDFDEKSPVIFFSHGSFGYYKSNYSTYAELASNGYVVVSTDHPYHAMFCKDTEGKTITVNPEFINSVMYINSGDASEKEIKDLSSTWLKLRVDDMNFVIDTIKEAGKTGGVADNWYFANETDKENMVKVLSIMNTEKMGAIGHSLGGATAEILGRERDDLVAVVDLDGTMLGENLSLVECEQYEFEGKTYSEKYVINDEEYPIPLLNIDNDEHHHSRLIAKEIGMPYANNVVMEHAKEGYDTWFVHAGHMNFTDLPMFSPFLAKQLGTGEIDSAECMDTVNQLVRGFFDAKLKGEGTFEVKDCYGN